MDKLQAFGRLLLNYYDKLVLGILLVLLAGIMMQQACKMQETKELTGGTGDELITSSTPVPEVEVDKFDIPIKLAREDYWHPGFQPEFEGAERLDRLSSDLRAYLSTRGEGSLVDPPVYMFSISNQKYLVHYNTVFNPETRVSEQSGTLRPGAGTDPATGTSEATSQELDPLIKHVHYRRPVQQKLPLRLANITRVNPMDQATWDFQFDVYAQSGRRSHFVKMGEEIPDSGGFRLREVEFARERGSDGIFRETANATIVRGEEEVILPLKQQVDYGNIVYLMVALPPDFDRQPFQLSPVVEGEVFEVKLNVNSQPRTERYRLLDATSRTLQVQHVADSENPKPYDNKSFEVQRLTSNIMRDYLRKRHEAQSSTTPGMPGGGGMDTF